MVDVSPGLPEPLGPSVTPDGTNFAIWSHAAEQVDLCLFDGDGTETARLSLPGRTGDVWHGFVPGCGVGQAFGYRITGTGGALTVFDPSRLLIDPYARQLSHRLVWPKDALGGWDGSANGPGRLDPPDTAAFVPRGLVTPTVRAADTRPRLSMAETVIYEAHLRGLTKLHPDVPEAERGTFDALGHPAVVDHLRGLGVTAIELLPVQSFVDDRFLVRRGLSNYWGYSTLNFFAPEPRYLGPRGLDGIRTSVAALHAAGIEVILDVVYNHTAELDETGPTLSFRGIDGDGYYKPDPDDPFRLWNPTGTGNALDASRPQVVRLIVDSLRHWAESYGVDGFRFDLAPVLGRNPVDFSPTAPVFAAIAADPILSGLKFIAEPWDIGSNGYRLGAFPPPWSEWNDRFRDGVRRFWRGDGGSVPALADALSGSRATFGWNGRGPSASINYVASHDGFTLRDLVSYEARHNERNGERNRDGHSENLSRNWGCEGPTDDPDMVALRARQARNMLATMFVSRGVPMLLGGDELGRSQGGNNNAYCQDNETSWIDWRAADSDLARFVSRLAEIRRDHPVLRLDAFFDGTPRGEGGPKDVTWLRPDGGEMTVPDWQDPGKRAFGMMIGPDAAARPLLILFNAAENAVRFGPFPGSSPWRPLLDTSAADGGFGQSQLPLEAGGTFDLPSRSVVLFQAG